MTGLEWAGQAVLDLVCSFVAILVVIHYDLEGRWEQRGVRRAAEREEAALRLRNRDEDAYEYVCRREDLY